MILPYTPIFITDKVAQLIGVTLVEELLQQTVNELNAVIENIDRYIDDIHPIYRSINYLYVSRTMLRGIVKRIEQRIEQIEDTEN